MALELMYVERKSGCADDGPAWIGYVKTSKSGRTVYFNDHAFARWNGIAGNFVDVETGDEYWISGVKRKGSNRHSAGRGKIYIDRRAVGDYLAWTGRSELPARSFEVVDIEDRFPVERICGLLNDQKP